MKKLVVYDSTYGNTEKIATAIGRSIDARVRHINDFKFSELDNLNLLILGSPVHGGRPTFEMQQFLKTFPKNSLKGIGVAAFDTRFAPEDHGLGLKILMAVINFAAPRMLKILVAKGGIEIIPGEGFIVIDKEGPIKKGEKERATKWAKRVEMRLKTILNT